MANLDDATLKIKITPTIDQNDFNKLVADIAQAVKNAVGTTSSPAQGNNNDVNGGHQDRPNEERVKDKEGFQFSKLWEKIKDTFREHNPFKKSKAETEEEKQKDQDKAAHRAKILHNIKIVGQTLHTGFQIATTIFKGSLNIVQDIYGRIKQASQMLQVVENLFNLAVNLLLLPLGNAIAEELIPAAMNMVEKIIGLWDDFDEFTGKGRLGDIMSKVFSDGLKIIGDFFKDTGEKLSDQEGILGSIGTMMTKIGIWIEKGNLEKTLNMIFTIAGTIMEHLGGFITAYFALKSAEVGATLFSSLPFGSLIGGLIGAGTGAGIAAYLGVPQMAEGGIVSPRPGGRLINVAEGGEPEAIVPLSKMNGLGGNTYNITINGMTNEELKTYIRDVISDQISESKFRSGF